MFSDNIQVSSNNRLSLQQVRIQKQLYRKRSSFSTHK